MQVLTTNKQNQLESKKQIKNELKKNVRLIEHFKDLKNVYVVHKIIILRKLINQTFCVCMFEFITE